jgi:hypothetical protein
VARESARPSDSAAQTRQGPRIPNPFLEHGRRRFSDIAFDVDAAEPVPSTLTTNDRVHHVPELMEQRAHLIVGHESGLAHHPTRHAGDQHHLRNLDTRDAAANGGRRCAGVGLLRTLVHIEVHTANQRAALQYF